jgi:hypothetical protein
MKMLMNKWFVLALLALCLVSESCSFVSTIFQMRTPVFHVKLMHLRHAVKKFNSAQAHRSRFHLSGLRGGVNAESSYGAKNIDHPSELTPITLLSGFLGTGKTSTLKHILENKQGLKVGVVVNDVAEVNIDARLIRGLGAVAKSTAVELQNGCACCSASEELLTSVQDLVSLGRARSLEPRPPTTHARQLPPLLITNRWRAGASPSTISSSSCLASPSPPPCGATSPPPSARRRAGRGEQEQERGAPSRSGHWPLACGHGRDGGRAGQKGGAGGGGRGS